MEENKKNYFESMSVMESIKKYDDFKAEISDMEDELYDMARISIVDRMRHLLGKEDEDGEMFVILPFALRMLDKNNEDRTRFYECVSVKRSHNIELVEWLWNEEKGDDDEYRHTIYKTEEMVSLYRYLHRMGFFDDKYENDFKND